MPIKFSSYRNEGHFYFDKIWSLCKIMTRVESYEWLARKLDIDEPSAHFSQLNNSQCKDAIYYCKQLLNDLRRLDLDFGQKPLTPYYK